MSTQPSGSGAVPSLDLDPFDEAFLADPYSHHHALRDAGPLLWLERLQCYAMARYDDVSAALRDHQRFCSGRGVGLTDFAREEPWRPPSLLLEADPPLHDRTRTLMNRIVSLPALRALRPVWAERAGELAERLVAMRRFDAVRDLGEVYPMMVFPDTIGLRREGREHLLTYAGTTFNAFGPRNAVLARSMEQAADAIGWVAASCKRENLSPGGWGMAVYEAADRGECTPDEAERLVRSFLSAGVDTTVNGLAQMMLAFASFPGEWTALRDHPALLRRVLDESLRWDGTVQTFFRTAACDVPVGDMVIPEGSKLLLFLAAANRDPRKWEAPDRFDISRQTSGHVGFGFGIHQCLGQMVARMEADLMLEALLPRIASIRLAGPVERRINNTLHALASVPVEIEPA
ncbi:cytochrome P450 [Sphingobium sp. DC-2]|uniref:cytochrome P450 n=1 Tax=Sphingobium sp. DC-2 TaxID=1303256 RepID=UPI000AFBBF6D|nr:cytochrome P450 [Sphingobium sp. DC-2]